jgi:hypothetical protein
MLPQVASAQEVLDFSSFLSKISQFKNPNFTLTHQTKTEFMLRAIPIVIQSKHENVDELVAFFGSMS